MNRFCLLATSLSLLTLGAEAQITKGTKLLGGSVGYSRSTNTSPLTAPTTPVTQYEYKQVNSIFNVSPQAGVFVADNVAAGISIRYSAQKVISPYYDFTSITNPLIYTQTARNNSFTVSPFLRYYYLPTATFGVFGQLKASYTSGRNKNESTIPSSPGSATEFHSFGISVNPALIFLPTDKLGLELAFGSIGYGRSTSTSEASGNIPEIKSITSGFGANFGFDQLSLGASYYFGR